MRVHLVNLLEGNRSKADEAVADAERRLVNDRQRQLVEQIVRFVHRPDERALDWEHAEVHPAGDCCLRHG